MMRTHAQTLACLLLAVWMGGCAARRPAEPGAPTLVSVAESQSLWTGVAVTRDGRIFVNFPRWSPQVPLSVGEVLPSGAVKPYPDPSWNSWQPGQAPERAFVCVQSVTVDDDGFLWVVDTGNPLFRGVVPGGAKLVKVDPRRDSVLEVIPFGEDTAAEGSYLNDVRVDTKRGWAYLTESGTGSLVAVNLKTKQPHVALKEHPSVKAENTVVSVEGIELRKPDGTPLEIHADGIALDAERDVLYYQALTGRTLYRVPAGFLRDGGFAEREVGAKVEVVGRTGPADGLWFSGDGTLYITAIEENAIKRLKPDGTAETVLKDPQLKWPDSIAEGPDGALYVTTSQLHLGAGRKDSYQILKIAP